jgi:hypothetical protein
MHSLTVTIGFGGLKIDKLVADRAMDLWMRDPAIKKPRV